MLLNDKIEFVSSLTPRSEIVLKFDYFCAAPISIVKLVTITSFRHPAHPHSVDVYSPSAIPLYVLAGFLLLQFAKKALGVVIAQALSSLRLGPLVSSRTSGLDQLARGSIEWTRYIPKRRT